VVLPDPAVRPAVLRDGGGEADGTGHDPPTALAHPTGRGGQRRSGPDRWGRLGCDRDPTGGPPAPSRSRPIPAPVARPGDGVNIRIPWRAALVVAGLASGLILLTPQVAQASPTVPHDPRPPAGIGPGQVIVLRPHRADLFKNRAIARVVPLPPGAVSIE